MDDSGSVLSYLQSLKIKYFLLVLIPFGALAHHWLNISSVNAIADLDKDKSNPVNCIVN